MDVDAFKKPEYDPTLKRDIANLRRWHKAAALRAKRAGFDIVSGGELFRAIKAGVPPSKIVFAGVGKSAEEIRDTILAATGKLDLRMGGPSFRLYRYLEDNVDRQRGKGVFEASVRALQMLNRLGYGTPGSRLELTLVYNPQGAVLPPAQVSLEGDYRKHLGERYGIEFTELFVLTNMPIQRFGSTLISKGQFTHYMDVLKNAYQPANLESVMCRSLLSVDYKGYVYDCDFNQMLGLPLQWKNKPRTHRTHLRELMGANIANNPITVKDHCYGCTAGQGSSCGGALAAG